jgi:geranylgeranyl reductase family protein
MADSRVWDVVVAGCGPAGAVAARELARRGFSVLIAEEHHEVGRPVQCAGLVTRRVFDAVPAPECVLNSLASAELIAPTGRSIVFGHGPEKAVVIDRALFDRRAAELAIDAGCILELGARVFGFTTNSGEYAELLMTGRNGPGRVRSRVVVAADGVQSSVGRPAGLRPPGEILPGYEAELVGTEGPADTVRILVGRGVAPGFFGWFIPSGEGRAILGLCCEPGPVPALEHFERLLRNRRLAPFIRKAQVLRYYSGSVPVSSAKAAVADRLVLVGDAAGQVKPISGGGIYTGTKCALIAGEIVATALERDDLSARALREYERRWKAELGRELAVGRRVRRAFVNVTDGQMDELVRMLDRPRLLELISDRGDLDFPSKLAKLLFRQAPGLLKFAGPFVKSLF